MTPLQSQLEELGLSPSEARVLIALLQVGQATAPELSKLAGVPRTNTYPVIESLAAKRLAARVAGSGPAVWSAPPQDDVIAQLEANLVVFHEQQLRQHQSVGARAAELMAELLAEAPLLAAPTVVLVHGAVQAKRAYDQLVAQTERELLVCNRPPYSHDPRFPNPVALGALHQGLRARVLYLADVWSNPVDESQRKAFRTYHEAGVEWRVAHDIPMKMAVSDARRAMVSFPEADYPERLGMTLVIDHPPYAGLHAAMFEVLWASARPGMEFVDELAEIDRPLARADNPAS